MLRYGVAAETLKNTFLVVQEMFLTETARLADVVLPAANLYEKAGTVTNTFGDQQLVNKAGDTAGTRSDFELIVRIATKMGADAKKLVPYGQGGTRRSRTEPRRAVGRSGPPRRVARRQSPGTQAEPTRSLRRARRDRASGSGLRRAADGTDGGQRRAFRICPPQATPFRRAAIWCCRPPIPCLPPAAWAAIAKN